MDELLEELGLTKLEVKIYKTLLNEGSSLAGDISKKTGIHRRNIYDALERLSHKGMVAYIKENNKKRYHITNPEIIANKLRQREDDFAQLLPSIMAKYNTIHDKKETLFYRGKGGLKLIFEDQIKEGKEVLVNATNQSEILIVSASELDLGTYTVHVYGEDASGNAIDEYLEFEIVENIIEKRNKI
mgnify:CR=1 FL=1